MDLQFLHAALCGHDGNSGVADPTRVLTNTSFAISHPVFLSSLPPLTSVSLIDGPYSIWYILSLEATFFISFSLSFLCSVIPYCLSLHFSLLYISLCSAYLSILCLSLSISFSLLLCFVNSDFLRLCFESRISSLSSLFSLYSVILSSVCWLHIISLNSAVLVFFFA